MAIVFAARAVGHSRRGSVKVLRPQLATSIGDARFLREIARTTMPTPFTRAS